VQLTGEKSTLLPLFFPAYTNAGRKKVQFKKALFCSVLSQIITF